MDKFDLKSLGVQEMTEQDVNTINGGWVATLVKDLIFSIIVGELLDTGADNDFENGRDAAKSFWY